MNKDFIVPTGRIIKEYLDEYNISQKALAAHLGMSQKHISNLLNGKSRLTEEVAIMLESIFNDIPASYWINFESKYREYLARESFTNKLTEIDLVEIAKIFKFKEVFEGLEWDIYKQAIEMLKLLKISDFQNFNAAYADLAATEFMEDGGNFESMVVWLKLCEEEIEVQNDDLNNINYNNKELNKNLPLFKMLALSDSLESITINCRRLCNKLGIYLVLYPTITNCKIRGALTTYKGHPAIYISGRFKTHDHIWFAVLHEIGHLIKHYNVKDTFVSYDDEDNAISDGKESVANSFARDFFIDASAYSVFLTTNQIDEKSIRNFSVSQKVLPGIVTARLQHDGYLEKSKFNYLKIKIDLYEN